jgi:raffinose/stachyose/melibiose transport system substrate-binding protein
LSHEPYASNIDPVFKKAASINGKLYAVPFGSEQAGAVVYNRKVYKKYGLSVPKTWKEFIHNCDILKKNGESA